MEITISLSASNPSSRFTPGKTYFSVGVNMRGQYVVDTVLLESIQGKDKNGNDCVIFTGGIRILGKLSDLYHTRSEADRHAQEPKEPSGLVGDFDLAKLGLARRQDLIEALTVLDPKFDVAGTSHADLQWRVAKRLKAGAPLPSILKKYA